MSRSLRFLLLLLCAAGHRTYAVHVLFPSFVWWYVCMCVCMYACMHVCMYVCIHICMYASTNICLQVCFYACKYVDVCT